MPLPFTWPGKKDEPEARRRREARVSRGAGRGPAAGDCRQGHAKRAPPPKATPRPGRTHPLLWPTGPGAGTGQSTGAGLLDGAPLASRRRRGRHAGRKTRRPGQQGRPPGRRRPPLPPTAGAAPPIADAAARAPCSRCRKNSISSTPSFKALSEKAAAIDALKEAFVPTLVKVRDGLSEQHAALGGGIRQVQQQFDEGLRALGSMLQPVVAHFQPPPEGRRRSPATGRRPSSAAIWPSIPDWIASGSDCSPASCQGEPAACAWSGQLLVFRSSPAEKMPALLKEIGEAYYRWSPRSGGRADEMENALVAWLQRACEQAGMSNTIELVHPGQRFDSMRHNAAERGVEITQVFGWIVLRDNGKVYTKASVAVK